ncbi:MAG: MMPL family transporter [Euryarchaeota archaeon]|nr:MMPL family transporter [Euryarchaeota archaeon]
MAMGRASVEGYAIFRWFAGLVTKRPRLLVIVWLLVFAAAIFANQVWRSQDVITFTFTLPEDTESAKAQRIVEEQFPIALANSTATVVLVAEDVTVQPYRDFVEDLHDAIVAASELDEGEETTLTLRSGDTLGVERRIEFLEDPSNATIYGAYASYAYELAANFNGPVHQQVLFTQSAAGVYWGLPAVFLGAWMQTPPPFQNETAKAATEAYIANALPSEAQFWANASFQTFYQGWSASWSNASMMFFPPNERAETVVAQTLPAFLSTPPGTDLFSPEQRLFQLGMLGTFDVTNFGDPALVEAYALSVFEPLGVADLRFFEDLYRDLDDPVIEAELRAFAKEESLRYSIFDTPLLFSVDVTRFFVSEDRTILLMNYAFARDPRFVDEDRRMPIVENVLVIRDLVARVQAAYASDAQVYVTGSAPLDVDQEFLLESGAEFVATIVLVVVLIGLYFRSVVSPGLPILTIAIALLVANLFVYLVAVYLFDIHFTVIAVLQTVLLAIGTDYSIFLVSRYRDERREGKEQKQAVGNAVIWAGESVATSGGAVLIAFFALSLGSFPFVQGMGLTVGFAVAVALGLALTFIPAILMLVGTRAFWPSRKTAKVRAKGEFTRGERYFRRASGFAIRRAKAVVLAAILITIPATYLVLTDRPTFDLSEGLPPTESQQGIDAIAGAFGEGFLFPTILVVQFRDPVLLADGNVSVPPLDAIRELTARVEAEAAVRTVEGPTNPQGTAIDYRNLNAMPPAQRASLVAAMRPFIGEDDRTVRMTIVLSYPAFSREAVEAIDGLSATLAVIRGDEPELRAASLFLGGVSPILNDLRDSTNRDLQVMAAIVVIGLFFVLLLVLGSVLIPLRAILTILLSIAWTLAVTSILFQVWLGLDVFFVLPLFLFVMAMGLGMDYDIFIITRVREEVAKGKTDRDAILESVTRTGGIVSACGIIMAGAFATLLISPLPILKEIGFALAFAILLDSSVVRIYLVPAIMVLAGKYNWWAPGRLQRVRRGEPVDPKA